VLAHFLIITAVKRSVFLKKNKVLCKRGKDMAECPYYKPTNVPMSGRVLLELKDNETLISTEPEGEGNDVQLAHRKVPIIQ
jgi:hypothetical protein